MAYALLFRLLGGEAGTLVRVLSSSSDEGYDGLRITVFSAPCEALFTSDRIQLHRFAWIFAGRDNHTPDGVSASLSGVSCFNGVINMKTPDFSLFSLPLKISLYFCRSPRMPFLPQSFQRRIPA